MCREGKEKHKRHLRLQNREGDGEKDAGACKKKIRYQKGSFVGKKEKENATAQRGGKKKEAAIKKRGVVTLKKKLNCRSKYDTRRQIRKAAVSCRINT